MAATNSQQDECADATTPTTDEQLRHYMKELTNELVDEVCRRFEMTTCSSEEEKKEV